MKTYKAQTQTNLDLSLTCTKASLLNPQLFIYAFLQDKKQVYFAKTQKNLSIHSPFTAISLLIHGIYHRYPEQAHHLLRNRIFTNQQEATPLSYGMVKVAAKRITYDIQTFPDPKLPFIDLSENHHTLLDDTPHTDIHQMTRVSSNPFATDHDWMKLALDLAKDLSTNETCDQKLFKNNRPIASILVWNNPSTLKDELLEVGLNVQSKNKSIHAEVNLIQRYYQRTQHPLPRRCKILTTLKPCRMCAGMIWQCAQDPLSLQIFYAKDDPGTHAKDTLLISSSADRRKFDPASYSSQINLLQKLSDL